MSSLGRGRCSAAIGEGARGWQARHWMRPEELHLVPLQLLHYDMVPTLLELLQFPEAWIGEELGQEGE